MIDKKYQELLQDILENGVEKKDRTGTGTISVFGRQIRHKMSDGFPLLTTKKMYWKGIVTELLWFLRGDTNIKYLVNNGCHIWDGDAYKFYCKSHWSPPSNPGGPLLGDNLISVRPIQYSKEEFINKIKTDDEFAKKWGSLGKIYGKQWRRWKIGERKLRWTQLSEEQKLTVSKETLENTHIDVAFFTEERIVDQIQNLIEQLKTNPDSRRLMVSAWNVGELDKMVLPPCHYGFQVYTRELSLEERFELYKPGGKFSAFQEQYPGTHKRNNPDKLLDAFNIPKRAISLMYNARSQDVPLGTPFNIASYGLLLVIIAKMVNMVPDELITNMGDCHIYKNQIDGIKEQLTREPYLLPKLAISDDVNFTSTIDEFLNSCSISDFKIENYKSHPMIKMPLSN
jgi:thymidylate synthase